MRARPLDAWWRIRARGQMNHPVCEGSIDNSPHADMASKLNRSSDFSTSAAWQGRSVIGSLLAADTGSFAQRAVELRRGKFARGQHHIGALY